jgi:hypothetical protein
MPEPQEVRLSKINGALLEAPVWEEHRRSSNWAAVIGIDAGMPGGLSRRFIDKGRGVCKYIAEQIGVFDAMEFAGDYFTWAKEKRPNRWYGVVTSITNDHIVLVQCKDGLAAIIAAKEMRAKAWAAQEAALKAQEKQNEKSKVGEEGDAGPRREGEPVAVLPGDVAEKAPEGERDWVHALVQDHGGGADAGGPPGDRAAGNDVPEVEAPAAHGSEDPTKDR